MTISPKEAQAHPRFPVDLRVSVAGLEGPGLRAQTLNLSDNGVRLTLPRRISPGALVSVTLHLRRGDTRLSGTIVWSDEVPPADTFGYRRGITFCGVQPGTFALDIFTAERALSHPDRQGQQASAGPSILA